MAPTQTAELVWYVSRKSGTDLLRNFDGAVACLFPAFSLSDGRDDAHQRRVCPPIFNGVSEGVYLCLIVIGDTSAMHLVPVQYFLCALAVGNQVIANTVVL